ncbi:unnamed protein product [Ceratitis capitata]|uniref:(Mediterranean fruit fly) hypothetical protein n=1 Tax=Ceratitis capitata TaxID=7213 RepID=A0A811URJ3_CERCA|nr:unnamed protein product [Ceratitis capitata]
MCQMVTIGQSIVYNKMLSGNNNRFLTLIETFNHVFKHTSLFNQIFRSNGSKTAKATTNGIDQSMRTANVNYQNRPRQNQFQGMRPASLNVVPPPYKQQRNFYIGKRQQNLDSEMEYQEEPTANFDENEYFQLLLNQKLSS